MKAAVGLAVVILALVPPAIAQTNTEKVAPVSTWSVHSPDIVVARRKVYPLAVFTPPGAIAAHSKVFTATVNPLRARCNTQLR